MSQSTPARRRTAGRVALVVAGALGVAAAAAGADTTSPAGRSGSSTGSSSSPTALPTLSDARALMFANHGAAAGRAYAAIVAARPADPDAHAAYAVYLDYSQDLEGAVAEARRAVAVGPESGTAAAALCRALDWTSQVSAAVDAGREAVALAPSDPLAHLFLSEALADHGDSSGSQSEIDRAGALLTSSDDAYLHAELHREQANLAHDKGDGTVRLAALQAAVDAQPGWVERSAELAEAYLDEGQLDGARAAFRRAVQLDPGDTGLLGALGRVSVLGQDYATAEDVYTRLGGLLPHDPGVLTMRAQVAMALHGDATGAMTLLGQALQADPRDLAATAYLLYLGRDVTRDEAGALAAIAAAVAAARDDGAPGRGRPLAPVDVDAVMVEHARAALVAVNAARAASGLPPVRLDDRLSASAAAHCFYWLFNNANPAVAKLGIHRETPGTPGFAGVRAGDRAALFGWRDGPVAEDITHRGGAVAAVGDWVDSVYHRFPIVRPDLVAIGYADCGVGPLPMEDMEFGLSFPTGVHHAPVVVPGSGSTGVPVEFVDNELPDPVPPGGPRTTGYPVTVTFDPYAQVSVDAFTLAGPDGAALPTYYLPPSADTENSASLLPREALRPQTRYTAHISGTLDGRPWSQSWSFTTEAGPARAG